MSFSDDLKRFTVKLDTTERDIFTGVVDLALVSIQDGSEITGSPGQPVDTGELKTSWGKWYESDNVAHIDTNINYAPYIEQGGNSRGPFTLRSSVGGFNSVEWTLAGFDLIVGHVTEEVKAGAA